MNCVPRCSRWSLMATASILACFVHAKTVTLTVLSDTSLENQLAAEGKTLADGDMLIKDGSGSLSVDNANGELLTGGTVKAGTLLVQPASGLGKQNADWTVENGATIRIGRTSSYKSYLQFHLSGTGDNGAGALAVYNSDYQTASYCDYYLDDDATMNICVGGSSYSGLFTFGRLHFGGHALTLKGGVDNAAIRQRLGGQIYDSGTLVLDGVQYTSGGVSTFSVFDGNRTMKLTNGSSYRVNVQAQFDAYGTFDGASGTTLRTDSGTLSAATFKNLTGSLTLDASLSTVTVNGILTARGTDLAAGTCLDFRQAVTLGGDAAVDLVDDETIEVGREYAIATATGGFVGNLPRSAGRAFRRQATLRFSDDRKTLYATFGEVPDEKDFGAVSAWYRFDDRPVGTVLGEDAPVLNEVNPALGCGRVRLIDKTDYVLSGIAPKTALPSELTEVYDPLTGVTFANRGALDFTAEAYGASSSKGSAIRIPGDGSNRLLNQSVTIEAFICSTGGVYNLMVPIVSLTGAGETTGESLALLVNANGFICCRYRTEGMASAIIWNYLRTSGDQLFDGRWHHVALVYDAEEGKVRVYVDYKQDGVGTADGSGLRFSTTEANCLAFIGGYPNPDGRKFNGRIDEVRIVGAALKPEQFLHRRQPDKVTQDLMTESTLLFVPMMNGVTGEGAMDNVNFATNTPAAYVQKATGGKITAGSLRFEDTAPSPGLRVTHRRANAIKAGSLDVGGDSGGNGTFILQNGYYDYFGDSFMVEGSFKTSVQQDNATIFCMDHHFNYTVKLMILEGNKFYFACNHAGGWSGMPVSREPVTDGQWHRYQLLFNPETESFSLYLDEVLVLTFPNTGKLTTEARVVLGAQKNGDGDVSQVFTGQLGPVRISRGKPEPCDWLSEVDPTEADPTMRDGVAFHLRGMTAEGLLDVSPYPSSRRAGEGVALSFARAEAPSFTSNVSRPSLYLYGEEDGLVATNTGSIHLENSALVFRSQRALDCYPQTIEFLAKFRSIGSNAHFFRLAMNEGPEAETAVYRIVCFVENGHLRFAFTTNDNGSKGDIYINSSIQVSELIGGWRHLAVSFDEDPAAGTTTLRTYLDYQLRDEVTHPFTIWHSVILPYHSLAIGHSNPTTNPGLVCDLDEFRITAGALSPEAFIRRTPRPPSGMIILVR